MTPPTGTAVCRTPSASPRSWLGNHPITARPLPDCTLPPKTPPSRSSTTSDQKPGANAAPSRQAAQPVRPTASVHRSPKRSAANPLGSIENVSPIHSAATTTPICVSERSYWSRIAGAITGTAKPTVENPACAAKPAASTAQR